MRYCQRCILPENFPGADLDDRGFCAYCRAERSVASNRERRREALRERFLRLCDEVRGLQPYDCLVAWSGGKDSTFTLAMMRRRYGLRPLAYTFDNGFVSPQALDNMSIVSGNLGVDHIIARPRFDVLRTVFREAAQHGDIYGAKALTRASGVCNACMGLAKGIALQLALRNDIPLVVYGWSPGQAPLTAALLRRPADLCRAMVEALRAPLQTLGGDETGAYFPTDDDWRRAPRVPYDVAPLLFSTYDEETVIAEVAALGWRRPLDTDPNSTNCLLNSYGNAVHRAMYGFHPYALELANLVRLGYLDRRVALARLREPEDPTRVAIVRERLGVSDVEVDAAVAAAGAANESGAQTVAGGSTNA